MTESEMEGESESERDEATSPSAFSALLCSRVAHSPQTADLTAITGLRGQL